MKIETKPEPKMKMHNVLFAAAAWLTLLVVGVPMSGWFQIGTLIVCALCLINATNREYPEDRR